MEKKDLIDLLNEIFIPVGFKRKGNNWVENGRELSKLVNLQKSNFGNSFYINYGYNIKGLETNMFLLHVYYRLAGVDKEEQKRVKDLLNLENEIGTEQRLLELKLFIINKIVSEIVPINTIDGLRDYVIKRGNLNTTPFVVKNYLQLN